MAKVQLLGCYMVKKGKMNEAQNLEEADLLLFLLLTIQYVLLKMNKTL
jgi:hypothetical protein